MPGSGRLVLLQIMGRGSKNVTGRQLSGDHDSGPFLSEAISSDQPVLGAEPGHALEVAKIRGQQNGIVDQRDRCDLQIHRSHPQAPRAKFIKLASRRLIERGDLEFLIEVK